MSLCVVNVICTVAQFICRLLGSTQGLTATTSRLLKWLLLFTQVKFSLSTVRETKDFILSSWEVEMKKTKTLKCKFCGKRVSAETYTTYYLIFICECGAYKIIEKEIKWERKRKQWYAYRAVKKS